MAKHSVARLDRAVPVHCNGAARPRTTTHHAPFAPPPFLHAHAHSRLRLTTPCLPACVHCMRIRTQGRHGAHLEHRQQVLIGGAGVDAAHKEHAGRLRVRLVATAAGGQVCAKRLQLAICPQLKPTHGAEYVLLMAQHAVPAREAAGRALFVETLVARRRVQLLHVHVLRWPWPKHVRLPVGGSAAATWQCHRQPAPPDRNPPDNKQQDSAIPWRAGGCRLTHPQPGLGCALLRHTGSPAVPHGLQVRIAAAGGPQAGVRGVLGHSAHGAAARVGRSTCRPCANRRAGGTQLSHTWGLAAGGLRREWRAALGYSQPCWLCTHAPLCPCCCCCSCSYIEANVSLESVCWGSELLWPCQRVVQIQVRGEKQGEGGGHKREKGGRGAEGAGRQGAQGCVARIMMMMVRCAHLAGGGRRAGRPPRGRQRPGHERRTRQGRGGGLHGRASGPTQRATPSVSVSLGSLGTSRGDPVLPEVEAGGTPHRPHRARAGPHSLPARFRAPAAAKPGAHGRPAGVQAGVCRSPALCAWPTSPGSRPTAPQQSAIQDTRTRHTRLPRAGNSACQCCRSRHRQEKRARPGLPGGDEVLRRSVPVCCVCHRPVVFPRPCLPCLPCLLAFRQRLVRPRASPLTKSCGLLLLRRGLGLRAAPRGAARRAPTRANSCSRSPPPPHERFRGLGLGRRRWTTTKQKAWGARATAVGAAPVASSCGRRGRTTRACWVPRAARSSPRRQRAE